MVDLTSNLDTVWAAGAAAVAAVAGTGAKILHLEHKVNETAKDVEEIKSSMKDDLEYLRQRLDALHDHLIDKG